MGSSSKVPVGSITDSRPIDLQVEQAPHAIEAVAVAKNLQVDPSSGLSSAEVAQRRTHYGANALQTAHSRPAWRLLVDQFKSLVVALLAAAAIVAGLTGDVVEAVAILGSVL